MPLQFDHNNTKPDVIVTPRRLEAESKAGPARPAIIRPRAATSHARMITGSIPSGRGFCVMQIGIHSTRQLGMIPVAAPLVDVAVHVVQTPGIGRIASDLHSLANDAFEYGIAILHCRTKLTPVSLTLEIPDDFAARLQTQRAEAEAQLHLELAVALYRQGQLPVANAASLAGLKLAAFEELLRQRGVTMPYTLEDLEHDAAYASRRR